MDNRVSQGTVPLPVIPHTDGRRRGQAEFATRAPSRVKRPVALLLSVVAGFVLVASACSSNRAAYGAAPQTHADSIFIYLDNNNFYDASVYVSFSGRARRRLAVVDAYTETLEVIRWEPGDFSFVVDFIGTRVGLRTRRISANPGEAIELQLTANAHRNGQLIVRRR